MGMRALIYLFVISLCAFGAKTDDDFQLDDGVLVLSKSDFQKAVDSIPYLLVEFCKYILVIEFKHI